MNLWRLPIVVVTLLALDGCATFGERHVFAPGDLPTSHLFTVNKDQFNRYLEQRHCPVDRDWEFYSTNGSGTAVFVQTVLKTSDHPVTYVLSADRTEPLAVSSPGGQLVLDEHFAPMAWGEAAYSRWGCAQGPIHFAKGNDPTVDERGASQWCAEEWGFDPTSQYCWTSFGPGTTNWWEADPRPDVIQIRDTANPDRVLVTLTERFRPYQLFAYQDRLYLFGEEHRDGQFYDTAWSARVFRRVGGVWKRQADLPVPLMLVSLVQFKAIDPHSGLVLICIESYGDIGPSPYEFCQWRLLNVETGAITKLDYLDVQGFGRPDSPVVPLLLERDFLSPRISLASN